MTVTCDSSVPVLPELINWLMYSRCAGSSLAVLIYRIVALQIITLCTWWNSSSGTCLNKLSICVQEKSHCGFKSCLCVLSDKGTARLCHRAVSRLYVSEKLNEAPLQRASSQYSATFMAAESLEYQMINICQSCSAPNVNK